MTSTLTRRNLVVLALLIIASTSFFLLHPSSPLPSPFSITSSSSAHQSDIITYIPFTYSYPTLLQTLHSYSLSSWPNIVIIDNSHTSLAHSHLKHLQKKYNILDIIPTPVHLRFSQLQSFIDNLHHSNPSSPPFYFWSHTDSIILPFENGTTYQTAISCVQAALTNSSETLGVMFFQYDILSAVTSIARQKAQWDVNMPQYGSDCDRYKRLRLSGLTVRDCYTGVGDILHLHSILGEEDFEFLYFGGGNRTARIEYIRGVDEKREQYSWRVGSGDGNGDDGAEMGTMDQYGKDAEGMGGERYFDGKWGAGHTCELDDRLPLFDVPEAVD